VFDSLALPGIQTQRDTSADIKGLVRIEGVRIRIPRIHQDTGGQRYCPISRFDSRASCHLLPVSTSPASAAIAFRYAVIGVIRHGLAIDNMRTHRPSHYVYSQAHQSPDYWNPASI
jgi:hypothetical protein